jgi:DNA-binding Xre family transcriptional regulator
MTRLGEIFVRKSINKADVARKTGLTSQRIGVLTLDHKAKLSAAELYLIALAIDEDPCKLLDYVCQDLK